MQKPHKPLRILQASSDAEGSLQIAHACAGLQEGDGSYFCGVCSLESMLHQLARLVRGLWSGPFQPWTSPALLCNQTRWVLRALNLMNAKELLPRPAA